MRQAIVIWAISSLLPLSATASRPVANGGAPPLDQLPANELGPPFFRMISRGTPDGLACFGAIAQCPAGRDMVLRPLGQEIVPNPPIRQSPFLFYPQEFRDTDCILRVWPSVPRRELDYLRGPPGPQNPAAAILTPHDWEQVQDMAVLLLLWLEHSNSRRGRIYMPLFGHEVTVELWCGPETSRVPWNIVTPWL